jgi:REP element-mobilizing transposase RayT
MVTTHVHVLLRTHPTTDLTRLVQRLKGGSSALAGKANYSTTGVKLRWAKGYSIATLGARALAAARDYLRTQPVRHPAEAIEGLSGDNPEYEAVGDEQWRGPDRQVI